MNADHFEHDKEIAQLQRDLVAMTSERDQLQLALNAVSKEPEGRFWQAMYKVGRDKMIAMTVAKDKAVEALKVLTKELSGFKQIEALYPLIAELEEVK